MITLSKSKLLKFAELSELQIDGRSEFAYTNRLEHFAKLVLSDLDVCMEHVPENGEPHQQLAAEQLNNKRLRDALRGLDDYCDPANNTSFCECDPTVGYQCAVCHWPRIQEVAEAREALSIPASTEALDAYVAEKVKEATLPVADELQKTRLQMITDFGQYQESHEQIATLTRQRDLAVEVLKTAYEAATNHDDRLPFDWAVYCEMLWQAIKKSEAK